MSQLLRRAFHGVGLDVRLRRLVEARARRECEDKWYDLWRPFVAHHDIWTILGRATRKRYGVHHE